MVETVNRTLEVKPIMKEVIIRYSRPAVVTNNALNIFSSYPPSVLDNGYDETLKFIASSIAHPGVVALIDQALIHGSSSVVLDESVIKQKTMLSVMEECQTALMSAGFEVEVLPYSDMKFEVGDGLYGTLREALDNVTDGGTIRLKGDARSCGVIVASGSNFTIDLNGHELFMEGPGAGSPGTETLGFQLLKDSTITFKNGIVSANDDLKMLIQNYCDLTLDNVTLNGYDKCQYLSSNNFGNVVYKNGTTFNVVGENNVAFDVYYGLLAMYDDGVHVTVLDDSIVVNGDVEFGKANRADESKFEERTTLVVPADLDINIKNMPYGFGWIIDGDTKHVGKL